MIKDLFKDMGKYLPVYIVPSVIGFFTLPLYTRILSSPDAYGDYILVSTSVTVMMILTINWITSSIIRFYPEYKKENNLKIFFQSVNTLLAFSVAIGVLLVFMAAGILKARSHDVLYKLMLIGGTIYFFRAISQPNLDLLRIKRKVNHFTSFSLAQSILGVLFGVGFVILFKTGIAGLLWGMALTYTILLPFIIISSSDEPIFSIGKVSRDLFREMVAYGIPGAAIGLSTWFMSLGDRYLLKMLADSAQVGIYSASYNVTDQSIHIIIALFYIAEAPIAMNLWVQKGLRASRQFRSQITKYYILTALPTSIGICILGRPLIVILTPPEYHPGSRIVPYVVFGLFLLGLTQRYSFIFAFIKKTYINLCLVLISGFLNMTLNVYFIPSHGYIGAAVATLISYFVFFILMIFVSRRYIKWHFPFKTLLVALVSSCIMATVVYCATYATDSNILKILLGMPAGVLSYGLLLLLSGHVKEEINFLLSIIRTKHEG